VSARRFVQVLVKRTPLAGADLARSNEIIREQPTRIGRVVELTRAAAQTVPKPTILLRWCEEVLRSQDEALREWARDPSQDAGAALSQLMAWAYPRIQSKGKHAARHRAEVCLLIGLNLLFAWRSLSPLDALRSVASAAATRGDRRRGSSLDRGAVRLIVRAGVKQLLDFGRIVALSEAEIASAEEARRSAAGMVENLRREMEAVEAARDALNVKVEELGRELAKRGARISELLADLEGARTRSLQDVSTLKARFRRQIGEGLAGLLADAWDAIDTDPPHPDVARERLEIAREAIRREMEWLDKSSD
jgi:hypothetical protein